MRFRDAIPFRRLSLRGAIALVLAMLSGCAGGSGSSGFDISPAAENGFILLALDSMQCVDADGLAICPANTDDLVLPGAIDTPGVPPPTVGLSSDELLASLPCAFAEGDADACSANVDFRVTGLPDGTAVVFAIRDAAGTGTWSLGEATVVEAGYVSTSLRIAAAPDVVQIAVLVYEETAPMAPGEIEVLSLASPDIVFVTSAVPLATL